MRDLSRNKGELPRRSNADTSAKEIAKIGVITPRGREAAADAVATGLESLVGQKLSPKTIDALRRKFDVETLTGLSAEQRLAKLVALAGPKLIERYQTDSETILVTGSSTSRTGFSVTASNNKDGSARSFHYHPNGEFNCSEAEKIKYKNIAGLTKPFGSFVSVLGPPAGAGDILIASLGEHNRSPAK